MNKTYTFTILLVVLSLVVNAQNDKERLETYENCEEYTYGFIHIKDSSQHIAPEYCGASFFSEGLAAVKKDGKWGFINADNETVIDFQYEYARNFKGQQAIVQQDDFYGVIDKKGMLVLPVHYYDLIPYELEGKHYYISRDSTFFQGIIDSAGKEILPHRYTFVIPFEANLNKQKLYDNIPFYSTFCEVDTSKGSFYQQFSEGFHRLFEEKNRLDIYDKQFNVLASKNVDSYAEQFNFSELTSINDYLEEHQMETIAKQRSDIRRLLDTQDTYLPGPKPAAEKIPATEEELNNYLSQMGYEKFSGKNGKTGVKKNGKTILPAGFDILRWWGMIVQLPSEEAIPYLEEHYTGRYMGKDKSIFAVFGIAAGDREKGALYSMKGEKVMELEHNVPEQAHSIGFTYRRIERDTVLKRTKYRFGFVNWEGRHILPSEYTRVSIVDDSYLLTKRKKENSEGAEEHFGLYSPSGKAIIPERMFSNLGPVTNAPGFYLAEWHDSYPTIEEQRALTMENKRFVLLSVKGDVYSVIDEFIASEVSANGLDVKTGMLRYKKKQ